VRSGRLPRVRHEARSRNATQPAEPLLSVQVLSAARSAANLGGFDGALFSGNEKLVEEGTQRKRYRDLSARRVGPMQKQSLTPRCLCGQTIKFPKRKNISHCTTTGCGVRWERGPEGYWAIGLTRIMFTPFLAKVKEPKGKLDHYGRYMEWREKSKRKAGSRC